ncbi:hypothetical protein BC831DRAFT_446703 [Entophlyctis helioformis]|nr:hypothetical protein BC831DRAFT_446703 [Entophlyctis helioformis]
MVLTTLNAVLGVPSPASVFPARSPTQPPQAPASSTGNAAASNLAKLEADIVASIDSYLVNIEAERAEQFLSESSAILVMAAADPVARLVGAYPFVSAYRRQICLPLLAAGAVGSGLGIQAAANGLGIVATYTIYGLGLMAPIRPRCSQSFINAFAGGLGFLATYPLHRHAALVSIGGPVLTAARHDGSWARIFSRAMASRAAFHATMQSTVLSALVVGSTALFLGTVFNSVHARVCTYAKQIFKSMLGPELPGTAGSAVAKSASTASLASSSALSSTAPHSPSPTRSHGSETSSLTAPIQTPMLPVPLMEVSNGPPTLSGFYLALAGGLCGHLAAKAVTLPLEGVLVHMMAHQAVHWATPLSSLSPLSAVASLVSDSVLAVFGRDRFVPVMRDMIRSLAVEAFVSWIVLEGQMKEKKIKQTVRSSAVSASPAPAPRRSFWISILSYIS